MFFSAEACGKKTRSEKKPPLLASSFTSYVSIVVTYVILAIFGVHGRDGVGLTLIPGGSAGGDGRMDGGGKW